MARFEHARLALVALSKIDFYHPASNVKKWTGSISSIFARDMYLKLYISNLLNDNN